MRFPLGRTAPRLTHDQSGAVGILFALLLLPMLGVTLTAIDYGRAIRLESRLQTAVDSAASAAIQQLGQERVVIESVARQHLDQQLPETHKGMPFNLTVSEKARSVEVKVETTIATSLIGLLGLDKFTVRASGLVYAERAPVPQSAIARAIKEALPRSAPPDVTRALEELSRGGGAGSLKPSEREEEEIRHAAEEAERLIRDALNRLGR